MANKCQKKHHKKDDFCYSRPSYREARWERAVKVYTINQESKYLLIQGVPSVGICKELIELCALYGTVEEYRLLDEYPCEEYTDVYWVKFERIQPARFAKKKLDNRSFFGGILHVCYAPEYENIDDTREKLQERRKLIAKKYKEYYPEPDNLLKSNNKVQTESDSNKSANKSITNKQEYNDKIIQSKTATANVPFTDEHGVSFQVTSDPVNFVENKQCEESAPMPYPVLPLPPVQFKDFNPQPPPSYEYPWVPTKHATLPPESKNIEESNWSSINPTKSVTVTGNNSSKNSCVATVKCDSSERKNSSKLGTIDFSSNISQDLKRKRESQIVFKNNNSKPITLSISHLEQLSSSQVQRPEPSAWDPHYNVRKQANSYTGSDSLDSLSVEIRQKLLKVSEPNIEPNISLYDIDGEHSSLTKKKSRKRI